VKINWEIQSTFEMRDRWDDAEDSLLKQLVARHGHQWRVIAEELPHRTPAQIAARWEKCLASSLVKGPFTPDEDSQIIDFVAANGAHNWPRMATILSHRTPKQCRERWFNHLDPAVYKAPWTDNEDMLIYQNYRRAGGKWSAIAKMLPGRTDNAIKNRFNSSISKRMRVAANGEQYLHVDRPRPPTKARPQTESEVQSVQEEPPPVQTPPQVQSGDSDVPSSSGPLSPFADDVRVSKADRDMVEWTGSTDGCSRNPAFSLCSLYESWESK
jgi:hypothetical protein